MLTFLVVDDAVFRATGLGDILEIEYENCRILTAFDGQAGLALALKHEPDLIVCNYMMPKMNGDEVLRNLHLYPWMASIPFLLTSAASARHMGWLKTTFGLDVDKHFMTCPMDAEEFLEKVELLLFEYSEKQLHRKLSQPLKLYPIEEGGQRLFTR
jgi:response regulator RpfG family c-di-GMP phosphodiesterase